MKHVPGSALNCELWPFSSLGQTVQVNFGPLKGLEGRVIEIKENYRLVISIPLPHRSVSVEIDRDQLTSRLE
jgi:transcription antitermination factor NusG